LNCGRAVLADRCNNLLVSSNSLVTGPVTYNQVDVIAAGGSQNVTIEKNYIVENAPGSAAGGTNPSDTSARHSDCIQTFAVTGIKPWNWIIRYNWVQNNNTVAAGSDGNSSLVMMQDFTGQPACAIYSNVFFCPNNSGGGVNNGVHFGTCTLATDTYYFYNNTFVKNQNPVGAISYNDANKTTPGTGLGTLYFSNNICWCPLTGASQGSTVNNYAVGAITANDFFNFGNFATSGGIPLPTISPTITTDPQFTNVSTNDYSLAIGSPCIGTGNNTLGTAYNTGLVPGCTWPNPALATRGTAWDMGAYIFGAVLRARGPSSTSATGIDRRSSPAPSACPFRWLVWLADI
jgi:hypothetical protein